MVLFDRIKFDGLRNRDWVIYKYPSEQIRLGSTLVVNEGQVAIFVKGGQVYDSFSAGSYILSTNNLPLLGSILNFFYDSKSPFTAEIFFINTTSKLDLYWGTSDPIQLIDPKYFVKLRIRAYGQAGLRIEDCMLFFREIIGGMNPSEVVQFEKVLDYFRGTLVTYIKTELASKIIHDKISALEISTQLMNLSNALKEAVKHEFDRFGFDLINFHIQSINFPDEDFDQINKILSDRARFEIMGDNRYATQRSFDVYEAAAHNSNGVAGAFLTGGVGVGIGMTAMQNAQTQVQPLSTPKTIQCTNCQTTLDAQTKFCSSCGTPTAQPKIHCPSCRFENDSDARFCAGCGHNLQQITCSCGTSLASDAKFCHKCGEKTN